jgi:hypothetical protein
MASVITEFNEPLAEESDYELTATLVGPDGTTPVQPAAIQSITADLRDLETGEMIFEDEIVTSSLGTDGEFVMPLEAEYLTSTVAKRFQKRQLTLHILQTNQKKRKHAIKFVVENLQDVP